MTPGCEKGGSDGGLNREEASVALSFQANKGTREQGNKETREQGGRSIHPLPEEEATGRSQRKEPHGIRGGPPVVQGLAHSAAPGPAVV